MNSFAKYLAATAIAMVADNLFAAAVPANVQIVYYVNGIQVKDAKKAREDARDMELKLNASESRVGDAKRAFVVIPIYNPKGFGDASIPGCNTLCQDNEELFVLKAAEEDYASSFRKILAPHNQSANIDQAAALVVANYGTDLTLGNNTALSSRRVTAERMRPTLKTISKIADFMQLPGSAIFVGHSQGNLLINLAWGRSVAAVGGVEMRKRIRVVNLANTSKFAVSGLDITHDSDTALSLLRRLPTYYNFYRGTAETSGINDFSTASPLFRGSISTSIPIANHFLSTYLSSLFTASVLADQGVIFTPGANKFVDRFVDLMYAANSSLELENGLSGSTFSDDFSGTSLDLTKWKTIGAPPVVSGGFATFSQATSASTIGKYTFSGNKFVVEFASPAPNPGHDTNAALVDVATGEVIQFGDTNYSGWGLYIQATGRYNLAGANINRGADTGYINMETTGVVYNSYKVFRLTVEGDKVTLERGDSASSLNEKTVRALGATTAGRTFYLRISTGGGVVYSPGTFDRVSTTAYQLPGKFSVSALDESTKGYTFTGASTSTCTFNSTGLWGEYLGAGPALALQYDADGIREDGFKSTYPATRVPSANSYSLIVQYRGAWFLAGKIKTLTLDPNEQLFFTINDTPGFFFNNVGQQSVNVSCDPLSISKSLALKN